MEIGRITAVRPEVIDKRLQLKAEIRCEEGRLTEAIFPQRETAALVPKFILLGSQKTASFGLLETIHSAASGLAIGRTVRIWEYNERLYCSFCSWRDVKFSADEFENADLTANNASKSRKQPKHSEIL